jgi:deoxycytidylate deaminase
VTHLPCVQCAKRLINLGNVKKVYYGQDYRIRDSIELLKSVGIEVEPLLLDTCYT